MKGVNKLIEKIKDIFAISDENVILKRTAVRFEAELDWDSLKNCWIICIHNNPSDFSIIHELGHIYFAKKIVNCLDFAIPRLNIPQIIQDILPLLNNLIDGFINYYITEFEELYPYYREKVFLYLDKLEDFKYQINQVSNVNTLLSWYFLFFIDFNYILKEKDRQQRISEITDLLTQLENNILQFKPLIDKNRLETIGKKLNKFHSVKSTQNPIKMITFFVLVLLSLDFWSKATLNRQMHLIFPSVFTK